MIAWAAVDLLLANLLETLILCSQGKLLAVHYSKCVAITGKVYVEFK